MTQHVALSDANGRAVPLAEAGAPPAVRDAVRRAATAWLRNDEVLAALEHLRAGAAARTDWPREAAHRPAGGSLFAFSRRACRGFRGDGHAWRKKADAKTVKEHHEELKVGDRKVINCYYCHAADEDAVTGEHLQRRCYWLLAPRADKATQDVVLVHYLVAAGHRGGGGGGGAPRPDSARPRRAARAPRRLRGSDDDDDDDDAEEDDEGEDEDYYSSSSDGGAGGRAGGRAAGGAPTPPAGGGGGSALLQPQWTAGSLMDVAGASAEVPGLASLDLEALLGGVPGGAAALGLSLAQIAAAGGAAGGAAGAPPPAPSTAAGASGGPAAAESGGLPDLRGTLSRDMSLGLEPGGSADLPTLPSLDASSEGAARRALERQLTGGGGSLDWALHARGAAPARQGSTSPTKAPPGLPRPPGAGGAAAAAAAAAPPPQQQLLHTQLSMELRRLVASGSFGRSASAARGADGGGSPARAAVPAAAGGPSLLPPAPHACVPADDGAAAVAPGRALRTLDLAAAGSATPALPSIFSSIGSQPSLASAPSARPSGGGGAERPVGPAAGLAAFAASAASGAERPRRGSPPAEDEHARRLNPTAPPPAATPPERAAAAAAASAAAAEQARTALVQQRRTARAAAADGVPPPLAAADDGGLIEPANPSQQCLRLASHLVRKSGDAAAAAGAGAGDLRLLVKNMSIDEAVRLEAQAIARGAPPADAGA